MRLGELFTCLCLVLVRPVCASTGNFDDLIANYENLLPLKSSDHLTVGVAATVFDSMLLPAFRKPVRNAGSFPNERQGELAYVFNRADTEMAQLDEQSAQGEGDAAFHRVFNEIPLTLEYACHTPGTEDLANPNYQNPCATAGIFRRGDWLVSAQGFSQYS